MLKQTKYQYKYDRIHFPASYADIEIFEDLNNICFMVYEMKSYSLILSKEGAYDNIHKGPCISIGKVYNENVNDMGEKNYIMSM